MTEWMLSDCGRSHRLPQPRRGDTTSTRYGVSGSIPIGYAMTKQPPQSRRDDRPVSRDLSPCTTTKTTNKNIII